MRCMLALLLSLAVFARGAEPKPPEETPAKKGIVKGASANVDDEPEEDTVVNLDSEEGFIDLSDALKSKHFVRRAILNTAIKNTSRFHLGRPYVNHLVGFNAILQRAPLLKMTTAAQGLAAGYVLSFGLGVEGGFEFSTLSNFYIGARYLFDSFSALAWPFAGFGIANQVDFLSVSEGTEALKLYAGPTMGYFVNAGVMIPLVDIGLKAEMRFNFYSADRFIITSGIGAVLFL